MPTDQRAELKAIRDIPALVNYLRDEMGWPIGDEDFEDLTFDYTPEELGIDGRSAAKIETIQRLRPLTAKQPWAVFFVRFEPRRLPIVALRRILSRVVIKKRASAIQADQVAWSADDILFISNYGEGKERQITLAHFSSNTSRQDLPTLRVLGWNDLDTALHLDAVGDKLTGNLAWPTNEHDTANWRTNWQAAFTLGYREVITTSRALSIRLAGLARVIRDRIGAVLSIETEDGPLSLLMKSFQTALVHDLDAGGFADMYAQTIAYGLLSARIANPEATTADHLPAQMPVTNPFLKELMQTFLHVGGRRGTAGGPGIDFDELGVSEVVELLNAANMAAVVRDFGDKNPEEDPVIHFYELFLKEYDPKKRMQRGVFYTPRPVVSYIVRSVDELLRTEFGLPDGLADTITWGEMAERNADFVIPDGVRPDEAFVQILDPATGTATFLVETIDVIYRTMVASWRSQGHGDNQIDVLWNDYVPKHLLPRVYGYELLMAPYAIAHLKIGLKLYETGYRFKSDERVRVYLTNALEPASDLGQLVLTGMLPALAHEAYAVNEVKRRTHFTVVIGNPPYSGRSYNLTAYARAIVNRYKTVAGVRVLEKGALQLEKNLNDDYVKFIALTQKLTAGHEAVCGLITNHSFLENPTLRGLRWHLLQQYSRIIVVDLGGNISRREKGVDENVFDIGQGVAISLLVSAQKGHDKVDVRRLNGTRSAKYDDLSSPGSILAGFTVVDPVGPLFLFRTEDAKLRSEYQCGISLTELYPLNSTGVKTHRDDFCIDIDIAPLKQRIRDLVSDELSDSEIRAKYGLADTHGWTLRTCRKRLQSESNWEDAFARILYRPFDWRHIYFSSHVVELARMEVSSNFLSGGNLGLVFMRQVASEEPYTHFGVTRDPVDNRCFYSNRGTMSFAPATIENRILNSSGGLLVDSSHIERRPNLGREAYLRIQHALDSDSADLPTPQLVLEYGYAVFHSPSFRRRFAEFLKVDFPRLPLFESAELFRALAPLGADLIALHLMETPILDVPITSYSGPSNPTVSRIDWSEDTVWLDAPTKKGQRLTDGTIGFRGVPEDVWNFQIGGYQVCEKWLKDRKGRTLTADDLVHYQKIVVALHETIRLMREIDEVIEAHGGWPGAFAVGEGAGAAATRAGAAPRFAVETARTDSLPLSYEEEDDEAPLRQVAEQEDMFHTAQPVGDDAPEPGAPVDLVADDTQCHIRQLFADGAEVGRDAAIAALARRLGADAADDSVRDALDGALRTAGERRIVESRGDHLLLATRSIEHYERKFLKEQLLAAVPGAEWVDRDSAINSFARRLGFRRTGSTIRDTAQSLVNGLLREKRLERDGSRIRRST